QGVAWLFLVCCFQVLVSCSAAGSVLYCYAVAAFLVAAPQYRSVENVASATWRQLGAIGAAGLLALLAYSAFRGDFASATFYGGAFGVAALGRLMFAHDALAVEAVALLGLVALAGATAAWRARERGR